MPTPEQQKQRADLRAKARALEDKAMSKATNLTERLDAWEKSIANSVGAWTVLDPLEVHSNPVKFEKQSDLSVLGGGDVYAEVTAKSGSRRRSPTSPASASRL